MPTKRLVMAGWEACAWHTNGQRRRAVAWRSIRDPGLEVRHCGHPTANYPYWIIIDGQDRLHDLGTFRLLADAQASAMKARLPPVEAA